MEKHISGLLLVIAAVFLLVGGLVGYNVGEAQIETNTITETVYQNVSVIEYIDVVQPSELDRAVETFLIAVEDEEDEAGNDIDVLGSYDFDEFEISKIYEHTVTYDGEKITVDIELKVKLKEEDEISERYRLNVTVIFESGEDTIVLVA